MSGVTCLKHVVYLEHIFEVFKMGIVLMILIIEEYVPIAFQYVYRSTCLGCKYCEDFTQEAVVK